MPGETQSTQGQIEHRNSENSKYQGVDDQIGSSSPHIVTLCGLNLISHKVTSHGLNLNLRWRGETDSSLFYIFTCDDEKF